MNAIASVELPFAHGGPPLTGILRATPEDFCVDEDLGFEPAGEGEHAFVRVEKRGANTEWVARQLAGYAGVAPGAVSYAGMKDRHAVTRQTYSVHLPGKPDPDWRALEHAEFRVLDARRHNRKLKRGAHKSNAFRLVLRNLSGDRDAAQRCLTRIAAAGVPNYFGEQRFGRGGDNLERARAMFGGRRVQRHEQGLLLSAARAFLFNRALAERVRAGNWNAALEGEVWMLAGSHSIFGPEPLTPAITERLASGDIEPTGPMFGDGESRSGGAVALIEQAIAAEQAELVRGLARNGLRQERRNLVLRPGEFAAAWLSEDVLELRFRLSKGSYATVLARELCRFNAEHEHPE